MKHLRHFCLATFLTFALGLSAFAGTIECGVTSEPIPHESAVASDADCSVTATCVMPSGETAFIDPVTGLALSILQSLLSVL